MVPDYNTDYDETDGNFIDNASWRSISRRAIGHMRFLQGLPSLLVGGHFVQPAGRLQQFAGTRAVGGAHQAVAFH